MYFTMLQLASKRKRSKNKTITSKKKELYQKVQVKREDAKV